MKRDPLIDQFADSLWLSDGLSRNTIESYGRDICQLTDWLEKHNAGTLLTVEPQHLQAFLGNRIDTLHASPRSTARLTSGMKRFFQYLLREKLMSTDPSAHLQSPKLTRGLPQSLSEADVEALLAAPDEDTPLGLRDGAMLETLYASGLRVTELVTLKTAQVSLDMGVVRVMGIDTELRSAARGPATLGVRPENLRLGGPWSGAARHLEYLGDTALLHARLGETDVVLRVEPGQRATPDEPMALGIGRALLFSADGRRIAAHHPAHA